MTKVCRKCGVEKRIDEFGKDSRNSSGRRAVCKSCRNQQYREQNALKARPRSLSAVVVDGKKMCSKCKKTLPVSQFWTNSKMKCGLNSWCKGCEKAGKVSAAPVSQKLRRFPPFKGYGFPENRERAYHGRD